MNKIAVFDIDGVLAKFEPFLVEYLMTVDPSVAKTNRHLYDLGSRYAGRTEVLNAARAFRDDPNVYYGLDAEPHAVGFVQQAVDRGYEVLFLTSRPSSADTFTRRWLAREIKGFDGLIGVSFTPNKAAVLRDIYPAFLIDDNPEEIEDCRRFKIPAFAWEQEWNADTYPKVFPTRGGDIMVQTSENDDEDADYFWDYIEGE